MARNKVQRSFRIPPDVAEAVDEYAEEHGITKSEAYRRVIKQGIEVKRSDVTVIQGTERTVPDGGEVMDRLDRATSQLNQIEEEQHQTTRTQAWLVIALVWVGLEVALDTPFFWTVPTGLLITVGAFGSWFLGWDNDE